MRQDLFLAKFDASGSWQWTVQRGGPADEEAMALRLDSFGNAWVAGLGAVEQDMSAMWGSFAPAERTWARLHILKGC